MPGVMESRAFRIISKYRKRLTRQQYKTLMGQVKAGHWEAALKGLDRLKLRMTDIPL